MRSVTLMGTRVVSNINRQSARETCKICYSFYHFTAGVPKMAYVYQRSFMYQTVGCKKTFQHMLLFYQCTGQVPKMAYVHIPANFHVSDHTVQQNPAAHALLLPVHWWSSRSGTQTSAYFRYQTTLQQNPPASVTVLFMRLLISRVELWY